MAKRMLIRVWPGLIGNGARFDNPNWVELTEHHNGSGEAAFGGAQSWPVVDVQIGFETSREDLATEYALAVSRFTHEWLKKKGLLIK